MMKRRWRYGGTWIAWMLALLMLASAAPAALAQGRSYAERIQFPSGATGITVDGYLGSGQSHSYVLWALAGQTMTVQSWYDDQLVFVTVRRANGQWLGSTGGGDAWQGVLPATGDYYITIGTSSMGAGTNYGLRIDVVNSGSSDPETQPERIEFAPGSTSTSVTGRLSGGTSKQYILRAQAGQVIDIQSWGVGVYRYMLQAGQDGTILGAADRGHSLSRTLPSTQDYLITVQTVHEGTFGANYGLLITITGNTPPPPTPTPVPPAVQEIRFPPNTTNTTVWGSVTSTQPQVYRLAARRGQVMTVQLRTERNVPARVTIATERGIFLGAINQGENWQDTLPGTQDYFLTLQTSADAASANYSLFVDIR